jgi:hypothetical protein
MINEYNQIISAYYIMLAQTGKSDTLTIFYLSFMKLKSRVELLDNEKKKLW